MTDTPSVDDAWRSPQEGGSGAKAGLVDVSALRQRAATSAYIGSAAAIAGMFTCIGSCFAVLASGILGAIAVKQALAIRQEDDGSDPAVMQLSNVAMLTGISSVVYASIFLLFMLLYIALYVAMFGFIIAAEGF